MAVIERKATAIRRALRDKSKEVYAVPKGGGGAKRIDEVRVKDGSLMVKEYGTDSRWFNPLYVRSINRVT